MKSFKEINLPKSRKTYLSIIFILLIFSVTYTHNLLKTPKYCIDEAEVIEPACNLANENRLYLSFRDGFIGLDEALLWHPPAYYLISALVMKMFSCGILQARAVSVIFGAIAVISVYFLMRMITNNNEYALLSALLLLTHPVFFMVSRTARMDILIPAFLSLAVLFFISGIKHKSSYSFLASGIFFGLGTISHLNGFVIPIILVLLIYFERKHINTFSMTLLLLGFVTPVLAWVSFAMQHFDIFLEQIKFQMGVGLGNPRPLSYYLTKEFHRWFGWKYEIPHNLLFMISLLYVLRNNCLRALREFKVILVPTIIFSGYLLIIKPSIWYQTIVLPFLAIFTTFFINEFFRGFLQNLKKYVNTLAILILSFGFVMAVFIGNFTNPCDYDVNKTAHQIISSIPYNASPILINPKYFLFINRTDLLSLSRLMFLKDNETLESILNSTRPQYFVVTSDPIFIPLQNKIVETLSDLNTTLKLKNEIRCECCYDAPIYIYELRWPTT